STGGDVGDIGRDDAKAHILERESVQQHLDRFDGCAGGTAGDADVACEQVVDFGRVDDRNLAAADVGDGVDDAGVDAQHVDGRRAAEDQVHGQPARRGLP